MLENDLAVGNEEWDALARVALALREPEDLGPAVDAAVMGALRAAPLAVVRGDAGSAHTADMMAAVRADAVRAPRSRLQAAPARPGAAGRAWRWLAQPRTVRVSPLGALAAAALAFVAATLGLRRDAGRLRGDESLARTGEFPAVTGEYAAVRPAAHDAAHAGHARDTVYVQRFALVAPGAREVTLVGDFNDWNQATATRLQRTGDGVWTAEVRLPPGRYDYSFVVDGKRWVADPAAPRAAGDDFGRPSSVVTVVNRSQT